MPPPAQSAPSLGGRRICAVAYAIFIPTLCIYNSVYLPPIYCIFPLFTAPYYQTAPPPLRGFRSLSLALLVIKPPRNPLALLSSSLHEHLSSLPPPIPSLLDLSASSLISSTLLLPPSDILSLFSHDQIRSITLPSEQETSPRTVVRTLLCQVFAPLDNRPSPQVPLDHTSGTHAS